MVDVNASTMPGSLVDEDNAVSKDSIDVRTMSVPHTSTESVNTTTMDLLFPNNMENDIGNNMGTRAETIPIVTPPPTYQESSSQVPCDTSFDPGCVEAESNIPLRKSARVTKLPSHLQDYDISYSNSACLYPLSASLCYSVRSSTLIVIFKDSTKRRKTGHTEHNMNRFSKVYVPTSNANHTEIPPATRGVGNKNDKGKKTEEKQVVEASTRVDPFGVDIFRSGLARQPVNPYFVTKISSKRQFDLFVPMNLNKMVLDNLHENLPEKPFLIDSQRRKWRTNLKKWTDGRALYNGGWNHLCRVNNICEEDRCICEFVHRRQGTGIDIKVHIVCAKRSRGSE
ncbi:hypothetical protein BUALT_Bualt15G0031300 [Buddleja alternifolia]|uniref:TF-B3 domain-containing protein n=1 Tax=Buddleja alternifolia TaxID=168488 RepID=A0AAV6WCV1_9LAMI|nr:hypothetical protein BUALT_Bualt15G0031300 [Buddleja alternifolia]